MPSHEGYCGGAARFDPPTLQSQRSVGGFPEKRPVGGAKALPTADVVLATLSAALQRKGPSPLRGGEPPKSGSLTACCEPAAATRPRRAVCCIRAVCAPEPPFFPCPNGPSHSSGLRKSLLRRPANLGPRGPSRVPVPLALPQQLRKPPRPSMSLRSRSLNGRRGAPQRRRASSPPPLSRHDATGTQPCLRERERRKPASLVSRDAGRSSPCGGGCAATYSPERSTY
jgi:hypothetical protein